jgi:hypothetical protein
MFQSVEYHRTVNKRQVGKGWGVMLACMATSAIHIKFMDMYSTDSFLMAMRRFMCTTGTPTRIQSDRGDQLVAALNQVKEWTFCRAQEWAGKKGMEWHLVFMDGQHFNGQEENDRGLKETGLSKL